MFNVGGAEFLVIAFLALIILGPDKLPEAARKIGNVMGELRQMSSGFKRELNSAMNDPLEAAARERGNKVAPPRSTPVNDSAGGDGAAPSSGSSTEPPAE